MISRYVKKPIEVEAVQLTLKSMVAVQELVGGACCKVGPEVFITLPGGGTIKAEFGDYVIKDGGRVEIIKPDIFAKVYERCGDQLEDASPAVGEIENVGKEPEVKITKPKKSVSKPKVKKEPK